MSGHVARELHVHPTRALCDKVRPCTESAQVVWMSEFAVSGLWTGRQARQAVSSRECVGAATASSRGEESRWPQQQCRRTPVVQTEGLVGLHVAFVCCCATPWMNSVCVCCELRGGAASGLVPPLCPLGGSALADGSPDTFARLSEPLAVLANHPVPESSACDFLYRACSCSRFCCRTGPSVAGPTTPGCCEKPG